MDINTVIIGHDEGASIQQMLCSLKCFGNTMRTWVLDRCSDNSKSILEDIGETHICTPSSLKGRQTSYCRNLGLSCTDIVDTIFLDGDRCIVSGTVEDIERDKVNLFVLEEDKRNTWAHDQFVNEHYGHVINGFYSCGLYIPKAYVERIIDFQGGELFRTDIQDVWGIEDTYLGDVCYHLGLDVIINKKVVLRGKFGRMELDDGTLIRRFKLRDKLNVKW